MYKHAINATKAAHKILTDEEDEEKKFIKSKTKSDGKGLKQNVHLEETENIEKRENKTIINSIWRRHLLICSVSVPE